MALDGDLVSAACVTVLEDLSARPGVAGAFSQLEQGPGLKRANWDMEKHVGLVMADGMSGAEEWLMEKIGDTTDVFFVGGSAGDDLKFQGTYVYSGGKAYRDSALLILLQLQRRFEIVKTQSFRHIGKSLVATAVDEARRTVVEFDNKPALQAYAEALGGSQDDAPARFFTHPLGLMIDGEPYVRSPQRADGNNVVFYCQIKQGMEFEILETADIVKDTRDAIEARRAAPGDICGLIDFQCILHTLQLRKEKRCDEYSAIFDGIPTAGFSTYGEAYLGHMNQTSTILLFR